jgi:hypothetical protein
MFKRNYIICMKLLIDKFGHKKIIDSKTLKSIQIILKFKIKIVYNQLRTLRMILN